MRYVDVDIGFIAKDNMGQFLILKLDSDLIDEPGEWKKFIGKFGFIHQIRYCLGISSSISLTSR